MKKNASINNFSGGEFSPYMDGRADLEKYNSACIKLENFRPLPWGGATYRTGTQILGEAKYSNRLFRLIPFNYSTSLSFIVEVGHQYMRFWNSNGLRVQNDVTSPDWVSGTSYTIGDKVRHSWDQGDSGFTATFTCISNISPSVIEPQIDPINWQLSTRYEISTSYTEAQIFQIQFKQINAQIRLVHPSVAPQTLTLLNLEGQFAIAETAFKYPPLLDQNTTTSLKLAVSALSGSTTLTATGGTPFVTAHVGAYFELQHLRPSSALQLDMDNQTVGVQVFSANLAVQGAWTFQTSQFWWGTIQVQRSTDNASTWKVIREFSGKSDNNFSTSGTEDPPQIGNPPILYRLAYTQAGAPFDAAIWTGSAPSEYAFAQASFQCQSAYVAGIVRATGFTDSAHMSVTVVIPPYAVTATELWSEGAFSAYRGFPGTIGFFDQRLLYSGTDHQPNNIWGSVVGDFDNFKDSGDDQSAVIFQPAVCQQNRTQWLASLLRVHLATTGEEIIMASGNLDEAITPSNITMRAQSYYGSSALQPIMIANSMLFVERNGQRVRELRELSPYQAPTDFSAPDLTLMAEHILSSGVVSLDFGRLPDPLAYFVRADGELAVLTYNREQNIMAWARYTTEGDYLSVACTFGTPSDQTWVATYRPHGNHYFIERFTGPNPTLALGNFLDSSIQYLVGVTNLITGVTVAANATQITGLFWLRGATVTAFVDGAEYSGLVVDDSYVVTLPPGVKVASVVTIGIAYDGLLTPMKPVMADNEGVSQGRKVRVSELVLRVRNSVSVEFAGTTNPTDWKEMQFRLPGDTTGAMTPLSTTNPDGSANADGIADWPLPQPWPDGNTFAGQINLRQKHPFPLTILGIFTKFDLHD